MNRTRWLVVTVAVLLVAHIAWRIWSGWGLITIHAENWPVSKVIREIEKQGHAEIEANVDPSLTVSLHVKRVPISEALESLAAATDARWRLAYVFGRNDSEVKENVSKLAEDQNPEGLESDFVPLGGVGDMEFAPPADPRRDIWNIRVPEPRALQPYLRQGAQSVYAAFVWPDSWNPEIATTFKPGPVRKLARKIASAANGEVAEVFFLTKSQPREEQPELTEEEQERRRETFRNAMTARLNAEIEKLPPAEREQARAQAEERRQMFEGMRELSADERRARMQEFMEDPNRQERMAIREAERAARMTPEQRMERAKNYLSRKRQAKAQQ